jgi:predicted HTH transcriptional regulator
MKLSNGSLAVLEQLEKEYKESREFVQPEDTFTTKQYAEHIGIKERAAAYRLAELLELGKVEVVLQRGNKRFYRAVNS